ncbi:MAG TPA: ATPase [Dehalococcoidia bacterium]|nr:ATPase [Dehalococcoidia bacterium]
MNRRRSTKTVVVTGDVTIDWNIARIKRRDVLTQGWNAEDLTRACCQRGGAAMLADIIKAIAADLSKSGRTGFEVMEADIPREPVRPGDDRFHHSYATWAPFELGERNTGRKRKVWRVREFLGLDRADAKTDSSDDWKKVVDDPANPDLVILDDANLGFRDSEEFWPRALMSNASRPWVLLKIARPVAEGKLWEHLQKHHAGKLIAVMTANDLRRHADVHISRQISWERTAQDLVWELLYNPHVSAITRCLHVVISFDTAGAILLSRKSDTTLDAILFFDPEVMEDEWNRDYPGYMIGYNTCLVAGIAREIILNTSAPDLHRGIQSGLAATRFLHIEGYGDATGDLRQCPAAFPVSRIAARLAEEANDFATAPIRNPAPVLTTKEIPASSAEARPFWTILEDQNPKSLEKVAYRIVHEGLYSALSGVPIGGFGQLATVDRREIEALNNLSNLIGEYCDRLQTQPLSVAVFGPPGSGKSFAVKQIAKWVRPGVIADKELTFNLSQFGGAEDLLDAFHQVRDKALSGRIPLVFWDEFDTPLGGQALGWLRYFLVPMQDGEYQEGQLIHPIGKSIFVFAGGTCHSMEMFRAGLDEEKFKAVKLPDFISRLRGFLNIMGPNRHEDENASARGGDSYYVIRRAILLRSVFERNAPQLFHNDGGKRIADIEEGLLRAFLLIKEYKHGVRSMEAIIVTSQLTGKTTFERSSLPTEQQLNLHVDGREFYALVHRMNPDKELLEKLAEAAHEVFYDDLKSKKYQYGPVTSSKRKRHSSLKAYARLPEDEKEQNRDNVRDIQNKLASVGYALLPARSNETPGEFSEEEVEKLAEMEHERWMRHKLETGWKYARRTNKAKKLHKDLVPWHELSSIEQEKDRVLVRGIPRIVNKAGYAMVKLNHRDK